jgi:thioredoxin-dependent peroxiredoxin
MTERKGVVMINGNPLTLLGNELKVGDTAPDFEVLDQDLKPVRLSLFKGKPLVIVSVPSIDTAVCDLETKRFNKEASRLSNDVQIITISMDLPFAQKRWCDDTATKDVHLYSDYRDANFGNAYGVLIKELRLLARTIFIVDGKGKISYIQYVKETTDEPDYDDVLEGIKKAI